MSGFFDNLFVLDMANNHQGDVNHGIAIVRAAADKVHSAGVRAGIKLQYRDLDTFVHPDFVDSKDNKHIPRFLSTRLDGEQFREIVNEIKAQELVSICTPFDEVSVDLLVEHEVEVIKIASCSADDWPLLEKIASVDKPIICSTAGLDISGVDKLVSFFTHRKKDFALMHCVALYPTQHQDLNLGRIDVLKRRYPFVPVGFSTHEDPNNCEAIAMAIAKGACVFERHIGLEIDEIRLNAYSSRPDQLERWIATAQKSLAACSYNSAFASEEIDSLKSLRRGVYATRAIKDGQSVSRDDVFFAMPYQSGQMPSGEFKDSLLDVFGEPRNTAFFANRDYLPNAPLDFQQYQTIDSRVFETIHSVKGLLYEARIVLGRDFHVELSHHYGIEKFNQVGAVIITCVNRSYSKKLVVQVSGQKHPAHYHKIKEETFQVLYGQLRLVYEGKEHLLNPGDQILVEPGMLHEFSTDTGVVFEEISTTHMANDSYYADKEITENGTRKTTFHLW